MEYHVQFLNPNRKWETMVAGIYSAREYKMAVACAERMCSNQHTVSDWRIVSIQVEETFKKEDYA